MTPVEYWPFIWNKGNKRIVVHLDVLRRISNNSYSPTVELIGNIAATILLTPSLFAFRSRPTHQTVTESREELARLSATMNGVPVYHLPRNE